MKAWLLLLLTTFPIIIAFRLQASVNILLSPTLGTVSSVKRLQNLLTLGSFGPNTRVLSAFSGRILYEIKYQVQQNEYEKEIALALEKAWREDPLEPGPTPLQIKGSALEDLVDKTIRHNLHNLVIITQGLRTEFPKKYCYLYEISSALPNFCSNSWISKSGVIFMDLSSSSKYEGKIKDPELSRIPPHMRIGNLASMVHSAVSHVLVPDVAWSSLMQVSKTTVVPIIFFHDSLHKNFEVDSSIKHEISQEIHRIVKAQDMSGKHLRDVKVLFHSVSLHKYKSIATVIAGAHRHSFLFKRSSIYYNEERSEAIQKEYLDADWILDRILDASQALLRSLLLREYGPSPSVDDMLTALLQADAMEYVATSENDYVAHMKLERRVLPAFVFETSNNLRLDVDDKLISVSNRAIITVYSPLENENTLPQRIMLSRNIVAGVAVALAGLIPPYYDMKEPYLRFAHGFHPFGSLSGSIALPDVMLDLVRRNIVLSRLNFGLRIWESSMFYISSFAEKYIFDSTLYAEVLSMVDSDNPERNRMVLRPPLWLITLQNFPKILKSASYHVREKIMQIKQKTLELTSIFEEVQLDLSVEEFELAEDAALGLMESVIQFHNEILDIMKEILEELRCCDS